MKSDYMETTQTRNTMAKLGYMGLVPFYSAYCYRSPTVSFLT